MIRIASAPLDSELYLAMVALRRRLLRTPLGLDFSPTELSAELDHIHLACRKEESLVGTVLVVPPGQDLVGRLRQMAVEPLFQRQGHGTALVCAGEAVLHQLGATAVALAARETAIAFYEKLGYRAMGESYVEITIPHVCMTKTLIEGG